MSDTIKILRLSFALIALFSGCGPFESEREYELESTGFDSKTLQMIQTDTGIALPSCARGLRFHYWPPIDPAYLAKIEISRSSKEEMTRSLSSITNVSISIGEPLRKRVNWWVPVDAKVLVERQTSTGSGCLYVVLTEEDANVILYIEWMTT